MKVGLKHTKDYILLVSPDEDVNYSKYIIPNYENSEIEKSEDYSSYDLESYNFISVIAYKKLNQEAPDLDLPLLPEFDDNVDELAKKYSSGKSSSPVFKEAHEEDFKAGYKAAYSKKIIDNLFFGEERILTQWQHELLENIVSLAQIKLYEPEVKTETSRLSDFYKYLLDKRLTHTSHEEIETQIKKYLRYLSSKTKKK